MPDRGVAQSTDPCGDIRDLIEDSLTCWPGDGASIPGDDLAAIRLLADLVDEAEAALDRRVYEARANDHSWQSITAAFGAAATEVRLRYDRPLRTMVAIRADRAG